MKYLDYIYVDDIGERIKPNYITQHFALVLEKNGLKKIRFHDLCHSCVSLLYANGASLKEIQEWLSNEVPAGKKELQKNDKEKAPKPAHCDFKSHSLVPKVGLEPTHAHHITDFEFSRANGRIRNLLESSGTY